MRLAAIITFIAATVIPASAQYGRNNDKRYRDRYAYSDSYGDVVDIRLREAGTLEEEMPEDMRDRVRLLHIEGPLDNNDLKFLKKLCGRGSCVDGSGRRIDNYIDLELERARLTGGGGLFSSRGERDVLGDELNYSSHLRSIVLPEYLKRIDRGALRGCSELEEVLMPPSVREIGDDAFYGDYRLNYVMIGEGVQRIGDNAFSGCSKLTDVRLPNSLVEIGDKAFEGTALRRVSLPRNLERMGAKAFDKVPITSLTLPSLTKVKNNDMGFLPKLEEASVEAGSRHYSTEDGVLYDASGELLILFPAARGGSFVVPDGVTTIDEIAFKGSGITSVQLPNSVTTILSSAFASCTRLTSVDLPETLTTLGKGAFRSTAITNLELPDGVKALGESTFEGCTRLRNIDMPSVTSLSKNVFSGCTSLTSFTISDDLSMVPEQAFENCSSLTELILPSRVTTIGERAFKGCSQLSSVGFNDFLATIGKEAFRECTSLRSIAIPGSCSTIDKEAFRGCKTLSQIELNDGLLTIGDNALRETAIIKLALPASVTHLGKKVAEKCTSLIRIECHATTPPQLEKVSNDKIELYVPADALETYKKAKNWKNFKRILPLN